MWDIRFAFDGLSKIPHGELGCGTRDLNPEGLHHMNLNHARLPIPPVPRLFYLYHDLLCCCNIFNLSIGKRGRMKSEVRIQNSEFRIKNHYSLSLTLVPFPFLLSLVPAPPLPRSPAPGSPHSSFPE